VSVLHNPNSTKIENQQHAAHSISLISAGGRVTLLFNIKGLACEDDLQTLNVSSQIDSALAFLAIESKIDGSFEATKLLHTCCELASTILHTCDATCVASILILGLASDNFTVETRFLQVEHLSAPLDFVKDTTWCMKSL